MKNLTLGTNSWVSLDEAENYFKTRLFAERFWNEALSAPMKESALVTAYNQILNCKLFALGASSEASSNVKMAQMEMALFLLQHGADMDARKGIQAQGVASAGIVQETYDKDMVGVMPIPANVKELLKDYQNEGAGIAFGYLTRDDSEDA